MNETDDNAPGSQEPAVPEQATVPLTASLPILRRLRPIPFAILVLATVFVLYQLVGGVLTLLFLGGKIVEENVNVMRWATFGGQILFLLVPTLILARLRASRPGDFFRWRVPGYREILLTVVAVFALQQILQGYMAVQDAIPLPGPIERFVEEFRRLLEETYRLLVTAHSPAEFLVVVLVVALTPAVCEEVLFRGLVQRSFEEEAGGFRAAIMTGVIFGAYHMSPFSLIPLAVLGIFFGFVVYRTGNLLVAVAAHFFNNFMACLAAYFQLEDDFVAVDPLGAASGTIMALNVLLFAVVFVVATYYFTRITRPAPDPGGRGV